MFCCETQRLNLTNDASMHRAAPTLHHNVPLAFTAEQDFLHQADNFIYDLRTGEEIEQVSR